MKQNPFSATGSGQLVIRLFYFGRAENNPQNSHVGNKISPKFF